MTLNVRTDEAVPGFGQLLRGHRTRIGLTQRALAELSTVSVRAIRDLEQGKARRPRQDTVQLIADGLRLSRLARADLELAADHGRRIGAVRPDYDAGLAVPPTEWDVMVGRTAETEMLVAELAEGRRRLIDLVGLSGVGKTRLASEVATRLHAEHRTPVLWVTAPCTVAGSVRDDGLVALVRDCATELFAAAGPGRDPAMADFAELVADRPTLLVLDGVAAPPHPEQIDRLLRDCPGLRILITATCRCDLPAERVFVLPPLRVPLDDEPNPAGAAAVRLFLDHAEFATGFRPPASDVPVVAEICRLLDGIPPALAAAASWLAVYDLDRLLLVLRENPTNLLEHLSDARRPARVHNRLTRSVGQLPVFDRNLLARLASLDEFSLEDVTAAGGAGLPQSARALRRLLERGLVRTRDLAARPVFQVLNLIRAVLAAPDVLPSTAA